MKEVKVVILLGFGSPDGPDDVRNFIRNILNGKEPSQNYVESVINKYNAIKSSPFKKITNMQAELLENKLCALTSLKWRVMVGMRYSNPKISDAIENAIRLNPEFILALSLSPHYSSKSTGSYFSAVEDLVSENVYFAKSFHTNSYFISALSENIIEKMRGFINREDVFVIFTAHSLPYSKEEEVERYLQEINETIFHIRERITLNKYTLAFQSRGLSALRWLEPDISVVLENLKRNGVKDVLLVPLSFVSDHIETLYDIDIVYKSIAEKQGINLLRTETMNTNPFFISALADVVINSSPLKIEVKNV